MQGVASDMVPGLVTAVTTSGRGLSPEYWAERLTARLISVGNDAPEPIRQQALAFRDRVQEACLHYMRNMAASTRTTVLNELGLVGK